MDQESIELEENDKNTIKNTIELNVSNDIGDGVRNGTIKTSKEEEAKEPSISPYPFFWSVRFMVITLLGFFGSMNLLALRVNLSIALPCMVLLNETENHSTGDANLTNSWSADTCVRPLPSNTTDKSNVLFSIIYYSSIALLFIVV